LEPRLNRQQTMSFTDRHFLFWDCPFTECINKRHYGDSNVSVAINKIINRHDTSYGE